MTALKLLKTDLFRKQGGDSPVDPPVATNMQFVFAAGPDDLCFVFADGPDDVQFLLGDDGLLFPDSLDGSFLTFNGVILTDSNGNDLLI